MDLRAALQQVRTRIARLGRTPRINEQNTKATLIEPLIQALGWDLGDLDEVHREFRRGKRDNPVDYALLLLRTPRLFVEAKALSENLDDRRWANQVVSYASVAGVEWVVLTNGDEYRIYNAHAPVAVEEKLFRRIRISDATPAAEETLLLLRKDRLQENAIEALWKAHFVDRQVQAAIERLFAAPDSGLVRLIHKQTPSLPARELRSSLGRVRLSLDFPLVSPRAQGKTLSLVRVAKPKVGERKAPEPVGVTLGDLIQAGVLTTPMELARSYKGKLLTARITPAGEVECLGKSYRSVSLAAGAARASIIGIPQGRKFPPTNGWTFWTFTDHDGRRVELDELRKRLPNRAPEATRPA